MFSKEAGRWSSARTPHSREWMDSANAPWVRDVTIVAAAQISKTESLNNVIGYTVHNSPRPIMLVMARRPDSNLAARKRILPMVRATPVLREEMTGRAHDATAREITFRRCILYMRSAQSPADLASSPASLVLCDELDKWPTWTGREASPLALVRHRTNTFPDRLIYKTSTPTTRDGLIMQEFEQGDQRRYHVPCPHCGAFQVLQWRQVKWNREDVSTAKQMRRAREAWYECEHCSARIDDVHRRGMLLAGVWVPKGYTVEEWRQVSSADRCDHRSYHIWAGYSPFLKWWEIVVQFLRGLERAEWMMDFVNSVLAEVWEDRVDGTTDEGIAACIDAGLKQWDVPPWVDFVTAAADVQKDRVEWQVQGWGRDEETVILAHGAARGEREQQWSEVGSALFNTTWGAKKLRVATMFVDSRWRRDEVIDFVRRWSPVAKMIAGVERELPIPFGTTSIDKHPRTGIKLPRSLTCWTVNSSMFKDLVAARIARALDDAEGEGQPTRAGRIHIPEDMPEEWVRQLASEHKVRKRVGNREKTLWVKRAGHDRNEAWDLTVYNAAAARHAGIDRHRTPGSAMARPAKQRTRVVRPTRPGRPSFPSIGGDR